MNWINQTDLTWNNKFLFIVIDLFPWYYKLILYCYTRNKFKSHGCFLIRHHYSRLPHIGIEPFVGLTGKNAVIGTIPYPGYDVGYAGYLLFFPIFQKHNAVDLVNSSSNYIDWFSGFDWVSFINESHCRIENNTFNKISSNDTALYKSGSIYEIHFIVISFAAARSQPNRVFIRLFII